MWKLMSYNSSVLFSTRSVLMCLTIFIFTCLSHSLVISLSPHNSGRSRLYRRDDDQSFYSIIPSNFYSKANKHETDLISMYNLIFKKIKFFNKEQPNLNEVCEYTFQNCMLNSDNNLKSVKNQMRPSPKCFPLEKAKFCLKRVNFHDSDCTYDSIEPQIETHLRKLNRNLEMCSIKFPLTNDSRQYTKASLSSSASPLKQLNYFLFTSKSLTSLFYFYFMMCFFRL